MSKNTTQDELLRNLRNELSALVTTVGGLTSTSNMERSEDRMPEPEIEDQEVAEIGDTVLVTLPDSEEPIEAVLVDIVADPDTGEESEVVETVDNRRRYFLKNSRRNSINNSRSSSHRPAKTRTITRNTARSAKPYVVKCTSNDQTEIDAMNVGVKYKPYSEQYKPVGTDITNIQNRLNKIENALKNKKIINASAVYDPFLQALADSMETVPVAEWDYKSMEGWLAAGVKQDVTNIDAIVKKYNDALAAANIERTFTPAARDTSAASEPTQVGNSLQDEIDQEVTAGTKKALDKLGIKTNSAVANTRPAAKPVAIKTPSAKARPSCKFAKTKNYRQVKNANGDLEIIIELDDENLIPLTSEEEQVLIVPTEPAIIDGSAGGDTLEVALTEQGTLPVVAETPTDPNPDELNSQEITIVVGGKPIPTENNRKKTVKVNNAASDDMQISAEDSISGSSEIDAMMALARAISNPLACLAATESMVYNAESTESYDMVAPALFERADNK